MVKILDESTKKQHIIDTPDAIVMQVYNIINILLKYH